jgi:hypothetical protein
MPAFASEAARTRGAPLQFNWIRLPRTISPTIRAPENQKLSCQRESPRQHRKTAAIARREQPDGVGQCRFALSPDRDAIRVGPREQRATSCVKADDATITTVARPPNANTENIHHENKPWITLP